MITERDLQAAIAECEGQRNPNSSTCAKLAAFYTIRDHMFPSVADQSQPVFISGRSFDPAPPYESRTEFGQLIRDKDQNEIMPIMDELMTALSVLNPKLYNKVMRMIEDLNYAH